MKHLAFERDDKEQANPPAGYYYDVAAGDRVVKFFGLLRHWKGEWSGQEFILAPWQDRILRIIFGWKRTSDDTRRFRSVYIELPRKNGKSTFAAGAGLYLLVADGEPGAEVYSAATKRDQAKLVWTDAAKMVRMSPELSKVVTVRGDTPKNQAPNMYVARTGSKFEPVGADSSTLDGLNVHAAINDELHAHRDRHVRDVLVTGMGSRRQPLEFNITTAGVYDPTSVGWEMHERAIRILKGESDDAEFFAYIACADAEDDPFSDETWRKANPNYGVSLKPHALEKEAHDARLMPTYYNTFLRYHLGIWTQQVERWIDMVKWNECGGEIDVDALEGRQCYVGLDMANTQDVAALVAVFPDTWEVLCKFFVPDETIVTRSQRDNVQYSAWARDGHIEATGGGVVDRKAMQRVILQWSDTYDVRELWYDPWNAEAFCAELADDYGVPVVACRQGFVSLNEPSKAFERLVYSGELRHGDHPVLSWMANNVAKKEDPAGNVKPDKKESREKIDGVVALILAIGAATKGGGGAFDLYDDREPLAISFG